MPAQHHPAAEAPPRRANAHARPLSRSTLEHNRGPTANKNDTDDETYTRIVMSKIVPEDRVNIAAVLVRKDRQEAAKAGISAFGSHFLAH